MPYDTREEWLRAAVALLSPKFQEAGKALPATIYVSVGLPKGRKAIGECWHGQASEDGNKHVFISPILDGMEAIDTLAHELVHVALPAVNDKGKRIGHGKAFVELAAKIGVTAGKPTNMSAGPELRNELESMIVEKLGPYPHARLDPSTAGKKQSTRLRKAECPSCGYTVRVTQKWLDYAGAPLCPADACEAAKMVTDGDEGESEDEA